MVAQVFFSMSDVEDEILAPPGQALNNSDFEDDEDEVLVPPAAPDRAPVPEDEDEILAPPAPLAPNPVPSASRPLPVRAPRHGTFAAWIVWPAEAAGAASSSSAASGHLPQAAGEADYCVGGLAVMTWDFDDATQFECPLAVSGGRGRAKPWGRVLYKIQEYRALSPKFVPQDLVVGPLGYLELERVCGDVSVCGTTIVRDLLGRWPWVAVESIMEVMPEFARRASEGSPTLVRTVLMTKRMEPGFLHAEHPSPSFITRWRTECGVVRRRAQTPAVVLSEEERLVNIYNDTLLELPANPRIAADEGITRGGIARGRPEHDPVKTVEALLFRSFLRCTEDFSAALDAGARYDRKQGDSDSDIERDATHDHRAATLRRSLERMDAVGMLLERRLFHAEVEVGEIIGINIYTDASPVTGSEVQGMVVEFLKRTGQARTCHLPGASLSYGHADLTAKTMAFVWAAWLVCGPERKYMDFCFKTCEQ